MNRRPQRPARSPHAGAATGTVRIVGGHWRGTKLPVADRDGLRPTSDRVRETLFNWLQPMLPGARVLDLFAGTGALGLEAVSRGARAAVLVERDPALAASLREVVARLPDGDRAQVANDDALAWLSRSDARFDLAFVDPPFAAGLWAPVLAALPDRLADDAWLYVESPADATPDPGTGWRLHREGRTRDVRYALYRRGMEGA